MTMIDRATRWVEATIVSDKSAEKATEAFMHYWVSRFGVPKYVISDNEKSFTSVFMKNLYFVLGARGCTTMVYHPQGNSPIESFHNLFRSQMVACQEPRWLATQEYLDTILLAYRNSYHTALGDSPAFLTYGCDLTFPIIRDYATLITDPNEERSALFNHVRERIFEESWEKAAREAEKHNLHRRNRLFKKGDLVLIRTITK